VEQRTRREREVDWASGACLLVRRDAAEAAGFFDERYFLYWEDVDLCAALRSRGGRILFTPAAEIVHARGRSAMLNPSGVNESYRRAQLAFYAKHHPRWLPLLRAWLRLRGQLPASTTGL
jgi:GT2 family glycosyltransferase